MTEGRSFSGHVYDLNEHATELRQAIARTHRFTDSPRSLELVWILPHDAHAERWSDPGMLFDIPVIRSGVDRPYLALRPVQPSAGSDHRIRTGMSQAMTEFDYGRAPDWMRETMELP